MGYYTGSELHFNFDLSKNERCHNKVITVYLTLNLRIVRKNARGKNAIGKNARGYPKKMP